MERRAAGDMWHGICPSVGLIALTPPVAERATIEWRHQFASVL